MLPAEQNEVQDTSPELLDIQNDLVNVFTLLKKNVATCNSFVIASSHKGEGASTIAMNSAIAMVQNRDNKVLLIDANNRRPKLSTILANRKGNGFLDLFHGSSLLDECIHETEHKGLSFLPVGNMDNNHSALYETKELEDILSYLNKKFTFVLIDGAPIIQNPETAILASKTGGLVMVTESEKTRWEQAKAAQHMLLRANARLLGVILNKKKHYIPNFIYNKL